MVPIEDELVSARHPTLSLFGRSRRERERERDNPLIPPYPCYRRLMEAAPSLVPVHGHHGHLLFHPLFTFPYLQKYSCIRLLSSRPLSFSSCCSSQFSKRFRSLPITRTQTISFRTDSSIEDANVGDVAAPSFSFLIRRLDNEDATLQARELLSLSVKLGVCFDHFFVANKLIVLLARSFLDDARTLFVRIPRRSGLAYDALASSYCQQGRSDGVHEVFATMVADGLSAGKSMVQWILEACETLTLGTTIHGYVVRRELHFDVFVCSALVDMYVRRGRLDCARKTLLLARHSLLGNAGQKFDRTSDRMAIVYAPLITSYCREQHWHDALAMLALMVSDGFSADKFIIPGVLKACSAIESLELGMMIHGYVIRRGLELDVFVGNSLIDMYVKCGRLYRARHIFDRMLQRDVVSWTVMITAYSESGLLEEAMECFESMTATGLCPDVIAWNALISACARCGDLKSALGLLDEMRRSGTDPGASSWNGIISGCIENGHVDDALIVFRKMLPYENPNNITISSILAALSEMSCLLLGKEVHAYIIRHGIETNVFLNGSIIDMYLKCGEQEYGRKLFESMPRKNATLWNEMIASFAEDGDMEQALTFVDRMKDNGVEPDIVTYNTLLASYARVEEMDQVLKVLSDMISSGLKPNIVSLNILVSRFQQCGQSIEALKLFQCIQLPSVNGNSDDLWSNDVINLFIQASKVVLQPDAITVTSALSACADLKREKQGKQIHTYVLRNWMDSNVFVSSTLVDMYVKCHDMSSAVKVFCRIVNKNVVSWNSLMAGYNHNAQPQNCLKMFAQMLDYGVMPSPVTIVLLLSVCSSVVALGLGRQLHAYASKSGSCTSVAASALIDMYAKCGSIKDARQVFDCTTARDTAVWNGMISGYAMHGLFKDAIILFEEMKSSGIKPDRITFTAILSACSHGGLIQEARAYFSSMETVYGIRPTLEHHTCMVGVLGSAGLLNESLELIKAMPFEPDACLWNTLLRACRVHSNVEVAEEAAKALFMLEPTNAANYIVMANIYAAAGMWDSCRSIRDLMEERGVIMTKECSWIDVNHNTDSFEAGDFSHPNIEEIFEMWDKLAGQMEESGYAPCDIGCEDSYIGPLDPFSCSHTEKFAICFGIISTRKNRGPIHVIKNFRMCVDCHTSAKLISQIIGREILVRDGSLYHNFKGGTCSCRDKW